MKTSETRSLIVDSFIALTQEMPLEKITIALIVERLNKNRKAFYYYFSSKEYLVRWIFRHDLGQVLLENFSEYQLVYETDKKNPYAEYPFYVFIKTEEGRLEHSSFFYLFSQCFRSKTEFYKVIFNDDSPGNFTDYLFALYYPQIKRDIISLLGEKHLESTKLDFLAEFYTGGIIFLTKARLNKKVRSKPLDNISPFDNIIHESLSLMFKENTDKFRAHY